MPPKARITKEMIVDAAFAVVRRSGEDDINVRKVANELGCSTQPVMYHFKTVEELKEEVYGMAARFYGDYLIDGSDDSKFALRSLTARYLRFAKEEPFLFKFIFQSGRFEGDHFDNMFGSEDKLNILGKLKEYTGLDDKDARAAAASVLSAVHGYASIIANNNAEFDESVANTLLENMYKAAVAYWKHSDPEGKKLTAKK